MSLPSPTGHRRTIHRLWVIVIIEVASRDRSGLLPECTGNALPRTSAGDQVCLCRGRRPAVQPARLRSEAGRPSARHPRYLGACWNEFSVDGAMANVCARSNSRCGRWSAPRAQAPRIGQLHQPQPGRPSVHRVLLQAPGARRVSPALHDVAARRWTGAATTRTGPRRLLSSSWNTPRSCSTPSSPTTATPHSGLGCRSPLAQLDFICSQRDVPIVRPIRCRSGAWSARRL